FASMPRCETCQSLPTPSSALYWHMGETTTRLSRARSASRNGENRAEAMAGQAFWGGKAGEGAIGSALHGGRGRRQQVPRRGARQEGRGGGGWEEGEAHHRERERLRAGDDRLDVEIFVGRMGAAADRADPADRRRADARRKTGIGAAAGELLAHRLTEIARAG